MTASTAKTRLKSTLALASLLAFSASIKADEEARTNSIIANLKGAFPALSGNPLTKEGFAKALFLDFIVPAGCIELTGEALDYLGVNWAINKIVPENHREFMKNNAALFAGLQVAYQASTLLVKNSNPPAVAAQAMQYAITSASANGVDNAAVSYVSPKMADLLFPKTDSKTATKRSLIYQLLLRFGINKAL